MTGSANFASNVSIGSLIANSINTVNIVCTLTTNTLWFISSGGLLATETDQKIGFYGVAPLVQQNSIGACDITDTAGMVVAINNLIARISSLGLISTTS